MRELAGWEMLLGGALLVFLLWRWRPWSAAERPARNADQPSDWLGFMLPILLVVLFVLAMVAVLRG